MERNGIDGVNPLWEQFELHYVRRLPPFRWWKRWLSVGCALAAAGWALAAAFQRDPSMFSSGAMSRGHAHLARNCAACHTESWRTLAGLVARISVDRTMNQACLHCHAVSIGHDPSMAAAWHQRSDESSPEGSFACQTCHAEHDGPRSLREIGDADCLRCHANLKGQRANPAYAVTITSFAADHPEFDWIAEKKPDAGRLLVNHAKHLDPNAHPDHIQMECHNCHRAGRSAAPWPFGTPHTHEDARLSLADSEPDLQATHMDPIRYSLHCMKCHELSVDGVRKRLGGTGVVPHDSPAVVRTFLWGELTQFMETHPEELEKGSNDSEPRRRSFRELPKQEVERFKLEWVQAELKLLESQVFDTKLFCRKCHEVGAAPDAAGLPVILTPDIPSRWLRHASFDHERHRTMRCEDCHPRTRESKETKDVLLPGIEVCRKCHAPAGDLPTSGASDRCALCHTYHVPSPLAAPVVATIPGIPSPNPPAETRDREAETP